MHFDDFDAVAVGVSHRRAAEAALSVCSHLHAAAWEVYVWEETSGTYHYSMPGLLVNASSGEERQASRQRHTNDRAASAAGKQ